MTAYDYSIAAERPAYSQEKSWVLKRYLDFTKTAAVASDVWTIAHIPINQLLVASYCARVTSAGGVCTVTVASVSNAHNLEANLDLNGTGFIAINDVVTEFFPAVDTIAVTINNSNTAAKFWLVFNFIDLSESANHLVNL